MFDPFPKDESCPLCDKNLNDLASGKLKCEPCSTAGGKLIANRTVLGHLINALVCLFNFEFSSCIADLKWAQERLCKSGDYDRKKGRFYVKGYLKD
jgi:hypothetical protein